MGSKGNPVALLLSGIPPIGILTLKLQPAGCSELADMSVWSKRGRN